MKVVWFIAVLVAATLSSALLANAAPAAPVAAQATSATPAWAYALYGNATAGWGLTPSTISKPGPTLAVTTGESLDLRLTSQDGATHTWFLDTDNNSAVGGSEPISKPFNATTGPIWFNGTITLAPGTYTYRCSIHPGAMWGELVVQAAPTFTLWGSYSPVSGWGFTNDTVTQPGPALNTTQGQTVTVDLFSADGATHTFYVDFAKSGSTTGNTVSAPFNATHSVRFTFVASSAGNFTYACGIHGQASMSGTVHIAAAPSSGPPPYTLYASAIVIIVVVAIVAAIVIRRKPRTPPEPPQA